MGLRRGGAACPGFVRGCEKTRGHCRRTLARKAFPRLPQGYPKATPQCPRIFSRTFSHGGAVVGCGDEFVRLVSGGGRYGKSWLEKCNLTGLPVVGAIDGTGADDCSVLRDNDRRALCGGGGERDRT